MTLLSSVALLKITEWLLDWVIKLNSEIEKVLVQYGNSKNETRFRFFATWLQPPILIYYLCVLFRWRMGFSIIRWCSICWKYNTKYSFSSIRTKSNKDITKKTKIILPILRREDCLESNDLKKVREVIYQMVLEDETITQKIKIFRIDIDKQKPRE